MFTNYSATYASQIAVFAGMVALSLKALGFEFGEGDIQFALGAALNLGGVIWALYERYAKGDVTIGGFKK